MSKKKHIALWIISIVLGLAFVGAGVTKLLADPMHVENFARWGLPAWSLPVVGLTELVAAVLLLVPRTRFWGSALLVATMGGALLTHLTSDLDVAMMGVDVLFGGLAAFVAWSLRPRRETGAASLPSAA